MVKEVSKSSHVGGHTAVIVFHILIGVGVLYATYRDTIWGYRSFMVIRAIAYVLIVFSLLAFWPILAGGDYLIS